MEVRKKRSLLATLARTWVVLVGASVFTVAMFFMLPLIQAITHPEDKDLEIVDISTAYVPPPTPPPVEEEEPEEEEQEEEPPELIEEAEPLDLAQLELALNPGFSEGFLGGDFAVKLNTLSAASSEDVDALFSLSDLDQEPRCVFQPSPVQSAAMRRKAPATVHIIFIVNERGKVEKPKVQRSTDPAFDRAAMTAIKQWRFEPGKRSGKPVSTRMRVPITFPKS
ncbi:MAG: energy transducer TonB [Planctomycetota bacterium]